jgi:hypothetical protein
MAGAVPEEHVLPGSAAWHAFRAMGCLIVSSAAAEEAAAIEALFARDEQTFSKTQLKRWPRFAVEDIHRFLGLAGGVFIAIHTSATMPSAVQSGR